MVLNEAMASGDPVIAYGRACIPDQLSGDAGISIPPGADFVAEAVDVLTRWANDRSDLAKASSAAFARARQRHEEGARELENLLALLCSSTRPKAETIKSGEARHGR